MEETYRTSYAHRDEPFIRKQDDGASITTFQPSPTKFEPFVPPPPPLVLAVPPRAQQGAKARPPAAAADKDEEDEAIAAADEGHDGLGHLWRWWSPGRGPAVLLPSSWLGRPRARRPDFDRSLARFLSGTPPERSRGQTRPCTCSAGFASAYLTLLACLLVLPRSHVIRVPGCLLPRSRRPPLPFEARSCCFRRQTADPDWDRDEGWSRRCLQRRQGGGGGRRSLLLGWPPVLLLRRERRQQQRESPGILPSTEVRAAATTKESGRAVEA
jgi:hypothetical protein